jgi:hypothetical protein
MDNQPYHVPRRIKTLPEHIQPLFDEELQQWGMYNSRLRQWCGKDEYFGHAVYGSREEAVTKFLENF